MPDATLTRAPRDPLDLLAPVNRFWLPSTHLYIVKRVPQSRWTLYAANHWLPHRPGPNLATYEIFHKTPGSGVARRAGILCYCYPPISSATRNTVWPGLWLPRVWGRQAAARLVKAHIATLRRLVILPRDRGHGLAAAALQATAAALPHPIIEAHSVIASSLKFFKRAGWHVRDGILSEPARNARKALADAGIGPPLATNSQRLARAFRGPMTPRIRAARHACEAWETYRTRAGSSQAPTLNIDRLASVVACRLYQSVAYAWTQRRPLSLMPYLPHKLL